MKYDRTTADRIPIGGFVCRKSRLSIVIIRFMGSGYLLFDYELATKKKGDMYHPVGTGVLDGPSRQSLEVEQYGEILYIRFHIL